MNAIILKKQLTSKIQNVWTWRSHCINHVIIEETKSDPHNQNHQDKVKGTDNLNFPEQLNDIVDKLADKCTTLPRQINITSIPIPNYYDGQYIANDYDRRNQCIYITIDK